MKKIYNLAILFFILFFVALASVQYLFTQKQKITLAIVTDVSSSVSDNAFNKLKEYLCEQVGADIVLIKPQKTLDLVEGISRGL